MRELFANQGYDSIMLQTFDKEDREILLGLPIDSFGNRGISDTNFNNFFMPTRTGDPCRTN